jgi:hypothetical protein
MAFVLRVDAQNRLRLCGGCLAGRDGLSVIKLGIIFHLDNVIYRFVIICAQLVPPFIKSNQVKHFLVARDL